VTRRFFNPLYVRPEDVHEVAYMPAAQRALVTWAGEEIKETDVLTEVPPREPASGWDIVEACADLGIVVAPGDFYGPAGADRGRICPPVA